MVIENSKIGWNFKNTYVDLPDTILTRITPIPVRDPSLVILNQELLEELGLDFKSLNNDSIANIFSGNVLPHGADPIAQAYAGHQFGHFTNLGDGRAIILGEHITPNNDQFDIQFKGSGQTPYSRGADGRAALGPMLREYIISESMHGLGIPTTRSLAVVKSGEYVFRESPLPGAILTRVAKSHIRVGTFQYLAAKGDTETLTDLVNYSIKRHYPHYKNEDNLPLTLLKAVMMQQINLIVHWMRVGFVHGVMNTDNMTISGESIDYGPCAFMDQYDEKTCFSSIDLQGRYAFANQPGIAQWNLARFAETLIPVIDKDEKKSIEIAEKSINSFKKIYEEKWIEMMKAKLGIFGKEDKDAFLILNLLNWMQTNQADYTNTFCYLMKQKIGNIEIYEDGNFLNWKGEWEERLKRSQKTEDEIINMMRSVNPIIIPRNHKVEEILKDAETKDDYSKLEKLLKFIKFPYSFQEGIDEFQMPSGIAYKDYKTFCGT